MLWQSCTGKARVDAADVEFVLGGALGLAHERLRTVADLKTLKRNSSPNVDAVLSQIAATHMRVLDFNPCQPLSMDLEGVD